MHIIKGKSVLLITSVFVGAVLVALRSEEPDLIS